jgi:hypothetical protein
VSILHLPEGRREILQALPSGGRFNSTTDDDAFPRKRATAALPVYAEASNAPFVTRLMV